MWMKSFKDFSWILCVWCAGIKSLVNSTLSLGNLEETFVSPAWTPWVCTEPVFNAIFNTPTEHFDCMATSVWSSCVLVDTTLVIEEVIIDGECSFHRSISVNGWLNWVLVSGFNDWTILALVFLPGLSVWACALAFWSSTTTSSVGEAWITDYTVVLDIFPGISKITTIASVVSGITTNKIFRWEDDVNSSIGLNTHSVRESFSSTESPAWTTMLLISDFMDAVWPLFSCIKVVR